MLRNIVQNWKDRFVQDKRTLLGNYFNVWVNSAFGDAQVILMTGKYAIIAKTREIFEAKVHTRD